MDNQTLKDRTKHLAINVARFCEVLPSQPFYKLYANQLIRCSSSVGANYRAACRAKSTADFINKLKIVEEECDETMFFLELICELDNTMKQVSKPIYLEANEILSMIVSSINTARRNRK
jgi:four helix bundle protein